MRWLLLLGLASCTGEMDETGALGPCDPLDPSICALPFPSSHFLRPDDSSATGWRVNFAETSLPLNRDGVQTRPTYWNERDGFSINSALLFYFDGASDAGTVGHDDIGASLSSGSRTFIVDVDTGELVPHWVELDATAPSDDQRLLTIRPAVPYEFGHHYAVGVRGLEKVSGGPVDVSPAFRALRDGASSDLGAVVARRADFDDVIFPALEAAGMSRDELQLAWDFRTASRANTLGPLLHMRDDALANLDEGGPAYVIDTVEDHDCAVESIARTIEGKLTSPYYTEEDRPGAFLSADADGMPYAVGDRQVPFLIRVPCSVVNGPDGKGPVAGSAPILQYGHGLLGGRSEARTGYLSQMADDFGWIVLAMDWTGFASIDVPGISLTMALDPTDFAFVAERSHQGMIEYMLGLRLAMGDLATDEALTFDGQAVIDPSRPFYYGNSQGAIMGAAYLAMSPDLPRGVLGVGGGPYSLLLPRSHDFDPFFLIFKQKYLDHRNIMLFVVGLTQQLWDPVEAGGWMWELTRDTDDPKQVLMQVAIYDNQVTTLGAHIQARAYGARTIAPQARPIWGVEEVPATDGQPWTGSALVEWEYSDLPPEPFEPIPPGDESEQAGADPHECPRREAAAQQQLRRFLEDGEVVQTCDGRCVGVRAETCP